MTEHVQDHFPEMFRRDRRAIQPEQLVRLRPDWDARLGGLWMLVKEVDPDFLTGLVYVAGEDLELARVPRLGVETAVRAAASDAGKWV